MSLGYWDVSPPGAVGRPFERDVGRRPLQCHPASDGWRDAARVSGLPEPADGALAPQTQEDQLRERDTDTDWERERERETTTEWETNNYVHTDHTQALHTCIFPGVCVNLGL